MHYILVLKEKLVSLRESDLTFMPEVPLKSQSIVESCLKNEGGVFERLTASVSADAIKQKLDGIIELIAFL
jgi:hypothetical protein